MIKLPALWTIQKPSLASEIAPGRNAKSRITLIRCSISSILANLIRKNSGLTAACDTLALMINEISDDASRARLKRFAEIYKKKMEARPYMEILARYGAMTEAQLLVGERTKADLYLDTHRFNELLYPEKLSIVGTEK